MSGTNEGWGDLQNQAERLGARADAEEKTATKSKPKESKQAETEPDGDEPAPPVRKSAGWGDESKSEGKKKRQSTAVEGLTGAGEEKQAVESTGVSLNRNKHFASDDVEDIMIIPDLDDDQEEDLQLQVAEAPQNVRQVQSIRELDSQIIGLQLPSAEQRLDLSILSRVLIPREKLEEPDEPWDFEQLLEQFSQEMTKQKESNEAFEKTKAEVASVPPPSADLQTVN